MEYRLSLAFLFFLSESEILLSSSPIYLWMFIEAEDSFIDLFLWVSLSFPV